jgi:hypothetical protein
MLTTGGVTLAPSAGQAFACMLDRVGLLSSAAFGSFSFCLGPYAGLDALSEVLVDVAPVLEGSLQHGLADAVEQVAHDVVDQPWRAASSSTSRTMVPAWPQSSSSGRKVYAVCTISPSAYQWPPSSVSSGRAFGPP